MIWRAGGACGHPFFGKGRYALLTLQPHYNNLFTLCPHTIHIKRVGQKIFLYIEGGKRVGYSLDYRIFICYNMNVSFGNVGAQTKLGLLYRKRLTLTDLFKGSNNE